ncbi:MAG: hypothetical protein AAF748_04140 [Pseudomonadota bacterium]
MISAVETVSTDAPLLIDQRAFFERVTRELSLLQGLSQDLQQALHTLPLAASDNETRQVLQSADRLTQSLACLNSAMALLSQTDTANTVDIARAMAGVFMEDMRARLAHGAPIPDTRIETGALDLF